MADGLTTTLPPRRSMVARLRGHGRAQWRLGSEAFCLWTGRPLPSVAFAQALGEGRRFEAGRGSWMSVLVPMVVFSQFVDVLIAHGVVQVVFRGADRLLLHATLLVATLWTVAWAVSLRSATRRIAHVAGPRALTLAIGFKHLCRIPLSAIANVQPISHRTTRASQDWYDVHGLKPRDVTVLAAFDKPTLLITLAPGATGAWWTCQDAPRPLRRHVAVYVDDARALQAALAQGPGAHA